MITVSPVLEAAPLLNVERDFLRHDVRGLVQLVVHVAEGELERVLARPELKDDFRLAAAEMHVLGVVRDCELHLLSRHLRVDEKVVVASVRLVDQGRRDADAIRAEDDAEGLRHGHAIAQVDEVDGGASVCVKGGRVCVAFGERFSNRGVCRGGGSGRIGRWSGCCASWPAWASIKCG